MSNRSCRATATAFTLIELLVVIAIIAILAAILFPVFAQARMQAMKTTALSNTKQISLALYMYTEDYDETYPLAFACVPTINGGQDYSDCPIPGGWPNPGPDGAIPIDEQLAPYIKNDGVWSSPADGTVIYDDQGFPSQCWDYSKCVLEERRSYNYVGSIVTQQWTDAGGVSGWPPNGDPNTGLSEWGINPRAVAGLDAPADTVGIAEVWNGADGSGPMGTAAGSFLSGCDVKKLAGRQVPPPGGVGTGADSLPGSCNDPGDYSFPAPSAYAGRENYAFADGHAKALTWADVRKNDFYLFKAAKPAQTYAP